MNDSKATEVLHFLLHYRKILTNTSALYMYHSQSMTHFQTSFFIFSSRIDLDLFASTGKHQKIQVFNYK